MSITLDVVFLIAATGFKSDVQSDGFSVEMSTQSLIVGNCGRSGTNLHGFAQPHLYSGKDIFARDLLSISSRRENGIWSKNSAGYKVRNGRKFFVDAKIRKGKKHDYPWPDDIDPNLSSGHLTYLSHFKPLTEKPKPVTLAFEKPLVDLEQKIIEASCFSFTFAYLQFLLVSVILKVKMIKF